jgi:hypothetical protein
VPNPDSLDSTTRTMNVQRSAVAFCLLLLPGLGLAQHIEIPPQIRAAAERITAERLMVDLEQLASDEWRGRLTPSPGLDSAIAFVVNRLKHIGVKPFGDDGQYLQQYTVKEDVADTAAAYLEIKGRRFQYGGDFLINRFLPTNITAEVVYVGHGFYAPSFGIDPYADVNVKGKILLVHGPGILPAGIRSGRLTGEVSPAIWEAGKRGALAVVYASPSRMLGNWERLRRANLSRIELDPSVPSA